MLDKMTVRELKTGNDIEVEILPLLTRDFARITRDKTRFSFHWNDYKRREVFKLCRIDDEEILGLLCLIDISEPGSESIKIELLESSAENIGSAKRIDHIAGCLIAYACRESFRRGRGGYVFLIPKSSLIKRYIVKYGFEHFALSAADRPEGIMVLHDASSRKLIKKYMR